jgi:hypothetical protein
MKRTETVQATTNTAVAAAEAVGEDAAVMAGQVKGPSALMGSIGRVIAFVS